MTDQEIEKLITDWGLMTDQAIEKLITDWNLTCPDTVTTEDLTRLVHIVIAKQFAEIEQLKSTLATFRDGNIAGLEAAKRKCKAHREAWRQPQMNNAHHYHQTAAIEIEAMIDQLIKEATK